MTEVMSHDPSSRDSLTIERKLDAQGVILALSGELDLASAPELDRELRDLDGRNHGRLLIDLSGLDFMDSTGLAWLIRAQQATQASGQEFSLRRGQPQVQRLFELTSILDRFTFEE